MAFTNEEVLQMTTLALLRHSVFKGKDNAGGIVWGALNSIPDSWPNKFVTIDGIQYGSVTKIS